MNLSKKFSVILILFIILPLATGIYFVYNNTKDNLDKVGLEISKTDISSAKTYIDSLIDEHKSNYIAWTLWNELYDAVKSKDRAWIDLNVFSNTKEDTFYELFIVYDINGNIISQSNPVKDWQNTNIKNLSLYKKFNGNMPCVSGIYKTSDGLYITTVTKVVKVEDRDFINPIGYIMYARKFNENILQKGKKIMNMDIAIKLSDNSIVTTNKDITNNFQNIANLKQNEIFTDTKTNKNMILIQTQQIMTDSDNNKVGVLFVQSSSELWMYFLNKSIYVSAVLIFMVIFLSISIFIWFKYNVIKTIVKITNIIKSKDLRKLLSVKGKDEITDLCNEFNKMIEDERELINNFIDSANLVGNTSNEINNTTKNLRNITQNQAEMITDFVGKIKQSDVRMQDITNNMSLLAKNVNEATISISQMSNSIQETSKSVEEASYSVNEVSVSIEQMDVSIKSISTHSKAVECEAQNTVIKAKEGSVAVSNTIQEIDKISQSVNELSNAIKKLGDSAEKIDDIVNVIDDIAEQTNLLSLNAAIEAARAGDSGKGFAVVANSIRSLAEKSSEATKDIAKLIKGIQQEVGNAIIITNDSTSRVKEGVQYAKSTGVLFEEIFKAIDKTSTLIQEITCSIDEQEAGSKEIMVAIEKMNNFVTELSAIVEEQAAGTEEIVNSVEQVNSLSKKISEKTEEQATSSIQKVQLIQEISKGTLDVSNGSEEIAVAIQNLAQQAQLITVVNRFKLK